MESNAAKTPNVSAFHHFAWPFYCPSRSLLNDNDTNYSLAILITKPESRERQKRGRGGKKVSAFSPLLSANVGFPGPIVMSTGPAAIPL